MYNLYYMCEENMIEELYLVWFSVLTGNFSFYHTVCNR